MFQRWVVQALWMSCRVMMIEFAKRMNASMTRVRFSVQIWSLRNPRACQELVLWAIQRFPAWRGSPFLLMT